MTPLEQAVLAGDVDQARAILTAKVKAKTEAVLRRKERRTRATGPTTAERRAERAARAAEIRAAVMTRAGDRCEWCHRSGLVLQWHHLRGGGERRSRESVTNTVAICADDHRAWERGDLATLRRAKEHAIEAGLRDGLAAIERRIAKIERMRRTPSVPIRVETKP